MAININDEYYTPDELAEYCVKKTISILGLPESTKYIEPSAGGGAFLQYLPYGTLAIDINPQDNKVVYGDFLTKDLSYTKGLCVVGNPPFGSRNALAVKFFKKAALLGDYISFILPISQLDNQQQMFEFDLVYSEDLGKRVYSGVEVHCCLNIYKRPVCGNINKTKPKFAIGGIIVKEFRRGGRTPSSGWDWSCCSWGSVGKTPKFVGEFSQEHYLYIERDDKSLILDFLNNVDWLKAKPYTSTPKLQSWFILKLIGDFIKQQDSNNNNNNGVE